jgi:hypothetical protein
MAKKGKGPSMDDFFEEDLGITTPEEEKDEQETEEGSDEQEEEKEKKKKPESKSKKKDEEEEESDDESEEEEEKPSKKVKPKSKTESEEESEEEDKEETKEESEDEPEVDSKTFFEEVDKLTGQPVEVDYGDVDPLTPQGIAIREKAVREAALDTFLQEIEQNYPTAYKALQYAYDGGDVAELFKEVAGTRDYSKVELKEDDEALATEILKEYYKSRGIKSEARINKMIEVAQDSEEGIVEEAKGFLKELQEEQSEKQTKALEAQRQAAAQEKQRDQVLGAAINDVLETGTLSNFKINSKEVNDFRKFVVSTIRRAGNGQYTFTTEVEPKNLEKQLQYLYFQFKKGDLSNLIQTKQTTEATKKLKLKLASEEANRGKKSTQREERNSFPSMKDYES